MAMTPRDVARFDTAESATQKVPGQVSSDRSQSLDVKRVEILPEQDGNEPTQSIEQAGKDDDSDGDSNFDDADDEQG